MTRWCSDEARRVVMAALSRLAASNVGACNFWGWAGPTDCCPPAQICYLTVCPPAILLLTGLPNASLEAAISPLFSL